MISTIIFYLFATVLVVSAALVVSVRNPVYAVLFLVLCFFNAAGLFVMMGAEFLAFILLIVYVGAVAVLFLFVVMMLDVDFKAAKREFGKFVPVALAFALVLFAQLALILGAWEVDPAAIQPVAQGEGGIENARALGRVLFTDYAYPFEVSGLILLVAMTGAIVLTLRKRSDARRQNPAHQTGISVSDVVEIKQVPSNRGVEL